jgi:hypothetical protein
LSEIDDFILILALFYHNLLPVILVLQKPEPFPSVPRDPESASPSADIILQFGQFFMRGK